MRSKQYVVLDNNGHALGEYVCTPSEADKIKDVRLVERASYVERIKRSLRKEAAK